jgi:hypothetical protein
MDSSECLLAGLRATLCPSLLASTESPTIILDKSLYFKCSVGALSIDRDARREARCGLG